MSLVYLSGPITVRIAANDVAYIQGTPPIYPVPVPTGAQGLPGVSPTVSVTDIEGGHLVTITEKNGTVSFDVLDGEKGETGATGATGAPGADGADGVGVPTGGITGQVLKKRSAVNYDTEWSDEGGAVDSVNGQTGTVVLDAADVGAVAVAQGVGHAGEFLVVGTNGDVTTMTLSTWQGGSY